MTGLLTSHRSYTEPEHRTLNTEVIRYDELMIVIQNIFG